MKDPVRTVHGPRTAAMPKAAQEKPVSQGEALVMPSLRILGTARGKTSKMTPTNEDDHRMLLP